MDYDLDIMLIALFAHRRFDGGTEDSVANYATDLFNRYNSHIVKGAHDAGIALDARERSVVASIAAMTPGATAKDSALDAIASYIELFDS
jgi:hypothetical protein